MLLVDLLQNLADLKVGLVVGRRQRGRHGVGLGVGGRGGAVGLELRDLGGHRGCHRGVRGRRVGVAAVLRRGVGDGLGVGALVGERDGQLVGALVVQGLLARAQLHLRLGLRLHGAVGARLLGGALGDVGLRAGGGLGVVGHLGHGARHGVLTLGGGGVLGGVRPAEAEAGLEQVELVVAGQLVARRAGDGPGGLAAEARLLLALADVGRAEVQAVLADGDAPGLVRVRVRVRVGVRVRVRVSG
eukprot:scaffold73350_cov60-Phaeocystis_antarctica.AAC.1